mmetsp:Transcript_10903/g.21682  ORF Transcript_10903/g.21682 Transcript_10903/m.21682 type:complete len:395 (-) Transcript_10903:28-1212(-)
MADINEDDGISPAPIEANRSKFKIFQEGEADPLDGDTSNFPEFNWEHVRSWVAIRHAFRYSKKQIEQLAAQDVVMLEKANGHRVYGSVEAGTLEAAKRIKQVNPKVKILFYLNAMCHYGDYAANKTWEEDWALRYTDTNELVKWRNRIISYDHRNVDFREWWIKRALDMTEHEEIDGVFIDGICKVGHRKYCPPDHAAAYIATANELRSRLQPGKLLIGNAVRAAQRGDCNLKHLKYLDGSYLEGWQQSKDTIRDTVELISVMGKQGRMVMLTSTPMGMDQKVTAEVKKTRSLEKRYDIVEDYIDFPLGVFLLGVEKWGYFTYHYGPPDANPRRLNVFDPTKFKKVTDKLGMPMGDYAIEDDYILSREFEHLKIRVDIEKQHAVITPKDERDEL